MPGKKRFQLCCAREMWTQERLKKEVELAERNVLDRRTFVKGMLAAGATVTVAACAPIATPGAATPAAPVTTVTGPSWIHPQSLVRAQPGYGGAMLTWKYGDTVKWLPSDKIPADASADTLAKLPKAKLTEMHYLMQLGRTWSSNFKDITLTGKDDVCAEHCDIGEEAVSVGATNALNRKVDGFAAFDFAGFNMRHHCSYLALGEDIKMMTGSFWCKTTGSTKGYCGYRQFKPDVGLFGAPGVIGLVWLHLTGAAWAFKVKKSGQVAMVMTGDGSCASRYAFPAVRSATNYKLPVVYVISNNFQGVSNPIAAMSPAPYVADYFEGMGLPCTVWDGNNIAQTYSSVKAAADRARSGSGPSVVELLTFRWYDHQGFAGAKIGQDGAFGLPYRTDDEVRAWMSRDPIKRYEAFLLERGLLTQADLDANKAKAKKDTDDAVAFARASPDPRPEDGAHELWYGGWINPATQFFEHKVIA